MIVEHYVCPQCKVMFGDPRSLQQHMKDKHKSNTLPSPSSKAPKDDRIYSDQNIIKMAIKRAEEIKNLKSRIEKGEELINQPKYKQDIDNLKAAIADYKKQLDDLYEQLEEEKLIETLEDIIKVKKNEHEKLRNELCKYKGQRLIEEALDNKDKVQEYDKEIEHLEEKENEINESIKNLESLLKKLTDKERRTPRCECGSSQIRYEQISLADDIRILYVCEKCGCKWRD